LCKSLVVEQRVKHCVLENSFAFGNEVSQQRDLISTQGCQLSLPPCHRRAAWPKDSGPRRLGAGAAQTLPHTPPRSLRRSSPRRRPRASWACPPRCPTTRMWRTSCGAEGEWGVSQEGGVVGAMCTRCTIGRLVMERTHGLYPRADPGSRWGCVGGAGALVPIGCETSVFIVQVERNCEQLCVAPTPSFGEDPIAG
jgi:hypothetical protein